MVWVWMKINGLKLITLVVVLAMTLSFCGCKRMNVLNDTSSDSEYTASTVITQTSTPDKSTSSTVSIEQPSTSTPEYPTTSTTTSTTTPTTSTPSTSIPSTSTPSNPTTSTPSTPSTTPSTPGTSTPSDTSSDSSNDDLAGVTWEWMTSTDGTQFRGGYVTIGLKTFLVDYDATYGTCKKCGLNGMATCRNWTCSNCGKTACSKAFMSRQLVSDNYTDYPSCPYCLAEYELK